MSEEDWRKNYDEKTKEVLKNVTELYRLSEAVKRSDGYQRAKNTVERILY